MADAINNPIPLVPENTIDPAAGLNLAISAIDAMLQVAVISVGANAPPGAPVEGARYIVGTEPTGTWATHAGALARWEQGQWKFYTARYALNLADNLFYKRDNSGWSAVSGSGTVNWSAVEGVPVNVSALAGLTGAADRVPYFTGAGTMALAELPAGSRTIIAAILGNAANLVSASGRADRTVGRAQTIGNLGYGQPIISTEVNGNSYLTEGLYLSPSSGLTNFPTGFTSRVLMQIIESATYISQIAFQTTGASAGMAVRTGTTQGGTITNTMGWGKVWTELNLVPNQLTSYTITTLPSAAANPRLQAWCSNLAGGAAPVYSNGSQWYRVADNTLAN